MKDVPSARAGEAFRLGADRAELAVLNYPRLTQPQIDFASSTAPSLLWRGGNSIGKSYGHAWDTVHFARGTHPLRRVPRGPVEILLVGFSFAQMDPLLKKLWLVLPKGEIHPKLYYAPGQGIRGFKDPAIPFITGPGRGSVIHIATYQQGSQRIMGFQGHRISFDEPPPGSIYGEARPRLNFHRGEMRVTMTPTPDSPPLAYMRDEITAGNIIEMQTSYTQAACTILGGPVPIPWKYEAEIRADIAKYPHDARLMREHGDWTPVLTGRWLELVTDANHVDCLPGGTYRFAVGMDHGTRPGREWATLVAIDRDGNVYIVDEAHDDGVTSSATDAENILKMLERNDLTWEDVDYWVGDRATVDSTWGYAKSNVDLTEALAGELDIPARELRDRGLRINTAHKERGSVRRGANLINSLAESGQLRILKRCAGFIAGARTWTRDGKDQTAKDPIDSARYAIVVLHDGFDMKDVGAFGRIH